jgi:hypothetical protein
MQDRLNQLYAQRQDVADKFTRLLRDQKTPFFRDTLLSLMDLSNRVDYEIIALEQMFREKRIEDDDQVWETDDNKYAEGHRQFLISQFEMLTGKTIKQM